MGNEEILNEKSEIFYKDLTFDKNNITNLEDSSENLNEKISLRISLTNIQNNCNYSIQIFSLDNKNNKTSLNRVEDLTIKSKYEAVLQKYIIINYYFEKEQKILIELFKYKNGETSQQYNINITIGCIMGSRKNTFNQKISESSEEILAICGEKIGQNNQMFILDFNVQTDTVVDWKEIKNKFIFKLNSENNPIYKSECISDTGTFNKMPIPSCILNKGIQFQFIDYKNNIIGDIYTNIQEMIEGKNISIQISKNKSFNIISKCIIKKNLSFIDYLKAGVQIGLSIAIDFTGSNGVPNTPLSLHYIKGKEPNQYEKAIYVCGNIVAYYDYDQLFPCYGFGAKINDIPTQIFNLNFDQNPNVHLIPNVIEKYHNALNFVKLWGPTNFGPILDSTINMVKNENNKMKYYILMILTDGMIDDIDYTINTLVEASFLPISVIIIGIGKADFSNMKVLDADENPLVNDMGVKAKRDIVQFVPFLKYVSNPEKLAEEVLAEIPKQLIEYYELNNIDPDK